MERIVAIQHGEWDSNPRRPYNKGAAHRQSKYLPFPPI